MVVVVERRPARRHRVVVDRAPLDRPVRPVSPDRKPPAPRPVRRHHPRPPHPEPGRPAHPRKRWPDHKPHPPWDRDREPEWDPAGAAAGVGEATHQLVPSLVAAVAFGVGFGLLMAGWEEWGRRRAERDQGCPVMPSCASPGAPGP